MSHKSVEKECLLKAMVLSCLASLGTDITKSGTKEETTMSENSTFRKENDDETIRISWSALTRTLMALFPDADITMSACSTKGMEDAFLVEVDGEEDHNFFYSLDHQVAFSVECDLMEKLMFVRAGVQERNFQHAVLNPEDIDERALQNAADLWDDSTFQRRQGLLDQDELDRLDRIADAVNLEDEESEYFDD